MPRLRKTELSVTICVDLDEKEIEKLRIYAKEHKTKMVRVLEKYIDGLRIPSEPRKARMSFEGKSDGKIKKTYNVLPETKIKAEKYAEMYGISVSDVVRRCIANLK